MTTKIVDVLYTGLVAVWNPVTETIDESGLNPDFETLASLSLRMFQPGSYAEIDNTGSEIVRQPQLRMIYDDSNESALFASIASINEASYYSYPLASYDVTATAAEMENKFTTSKKRKK